VSAGSGSDRSRRDTLRDHYESAVDKVTPHLVRFATTSPYERLLISVAALALSVVVGGLIVFGSGMVATCQEPFTFHLVLFGNELWTWPTTSCYDPWAVYSSLLSGATGNLSANIYNYELALTLKESTLLIFTGLSVAVAFKAGMFNIGTQGQLVLGALASAIVVVTLAKVVPGGLVGTFVLIPLAVLTGAVVGGVWGAIPGALKAYAEANEVITTIMLNFVAAKLAFFLTSSYFQPENTQSVETAEIPSYATLNPWLFPQGSKFAIVAFLFGLVLVAAIWYVLTRTSYGYDLRTSGIQPRAAEYSGVNADRTMVSSMALSGALGGIGGTIWVLMVMGRFQVGVPAFGFDGITVSILAGNNPIGAIFAALLFGGLKAGSLAVQFETGVPKQLVGVLRGLIILFVAMPEFFRMVGRRVVDPRELGGDHDE